MRTLLAISQFAAIVISTAPPALLGPSYPAPIDFTSNHSLIPQAWSNFTATIGSYIKNNQTVQGLVPNLGSYSFSVGAFSMYDKNAVRSLQHHHTGPDVRLPVNGDSVYRAESISKVFVVYLALIEIGSAYWDRPITDFVPYLVTFANSTAPNPIEVVDWKSVSIGALAGQIAGIPRDSPFLNSDLLLTPASTGGNPTALGFPPLNLSDAETLGQCINYLNATSLNCPEDTYLKALTQRPPVFSPWTTPIYTNGGFDLIAFAVENITGRTFEKMYQEDMFNPLGMTSTSTDKPINFTHAVIPGGNSSAAGASFGFESTNAKSGSIFSTTNDLAKFGLSILNSTLLDELETRKWLKPIAHTNSLELSVGRPWEIFRITQPITGKTTDLYTKEGDGTGYSSYLILSPDHGAGFSILISGNASTFIANTVIADALTTALVPALEAQAAAEAAHNYAGKYVSSSSTLNSSLTLAVDPSYGSGLKVTSWISNSTDMFTVLPALAGDELSLFPTDLRTAPPGQAGQVAFRGTYGTKMFSRKVGLFTDQVTTDDVWETVDSISYGGISLDSFVFSVDAAGHAVAVSPAVTRATLKKVG